MSKRRFEYLRNVFGGGIEEKSIPLSSPDIQEIFPSPQAASGVSVNAATALRVPAVLHAIRLISETIGSLPCKLYREEGDSKEVAKDQPAYRLVHSRANEWTGAGQLRVDLTIDALLHGAGFAEVVRFGDGRPFELHRLAPGTLWHNFTVYAKKAAIESVGVLGDLKYYLGGEWLPGYDQMEKNRAYLAGAYSGG